MWRYSQGEPPARRHALPRLPRRRWRRSRTPSAARPAAPSIPSRTGSRACSTTGCRGSRPSAARSRAGWRWRRRRAGTSPTTRSTRSFRTSAATSAGTTAPGARTSTRSRSSSSACGPGMRVLEVGAAKAWAAQHLVPRGVEYVATDILADPNIGLGRGAFFERRVGPFGRVQADGEHLPFADGAFDLAYCVAALHHALDLGRMVSRAGARDAPRRDGRGAERGHAGAPGERRGRGPGGGEGLRDQRARAHAVRVPVGVLRAPDCS